jgi:hypothetical protein
MEDAVSDITETVDTYLSAWNEPDVGTRAPLIEKAWATDGVLQDPPLEGEGHAGISAAADALHTHYAGHRFRRVSGVDTHHDMFRFAWELVGPDGAVAIAGLDVGQVAPDGRLQRITGFFGDLPEAS